MRLTKFPVFLWFAVVTVLISACEPRIPTPSSFRKIRQSNVYDDIVNGRIKAGGNIRESVNYFYNTDGTLDSVSVLDDTVPTANIIKTLKFVYQQGRVESRTYDSAGFRLLFMEYNASKHITAIVDENRSGLFMTYTDDKISRLVDSSFGHVNLEMRDFVYGANENLMEVKASNQFADVKMSFQYSSKPITGELDIRFYSRAIRFLYIGGLNLMTKCGLNFGNNNGNELLRSETRLIGTGQLVDAYDFGYTYDGVYHDIIQRSIAYDNDTLNYHFKY